MWRRVFRSDNMVLLLNEAIWYEHGSRKCIEPRQIEERRWNFKRSCHSIRRMVLINHNRYGKIGHRFFIFFWYLERLRLSSQYYKVCFIKPEVLTWFFLFLEPFLFFFFLFWFNAESQISSLSDQILIYFGNTC